MGEEGAQFVLCQAWHAQAGIHARRVHAEAKRISDYFINFVNLASRTAISARVAAVPPPRVGDKRPPPPRIVDSDSEDVDEFYEPLTSGMPPPAKSRGRRMSNGSVASTASSQHVLKPEPEYKEKADVTAGRAAPPPVAVVRASVARSGARAAPSPAAQQVIVLDDE
ncbi:hypothetical protein EON66_00440 [archaeon]|nr:MAG: hypothetical protein EON66_00440 [archaeon]